MSSPGLSWARPAEILRSDEKDRQHLDSVRRDIFEALTELVGLRHFVRHHQTINTLNNLIYYALTTLRDRQTLGEQYVNVVRCTPEGRPSSFLQRTLLLAEHFPWKQRFFPTSDNFIGWQRLLSILSQLHLIHFYLFGEYSSFVRRFARSRYALVRPSLEMTQLDWSFRIVGILLTLKLIRELYEYSTTLNSTGPKDSTVVGEDSTGENEDSPESSGGLQCALCRDPASNCTISRCGHVYCWTCITQWLISKSACPICRSTINPEQLVRILNR